MKRILSLIILAHAAVVVLAQPTKTAAPAKPLKNLQDSASYAMGIAFANACKAEIGGKVNTTAVMKAFDDVYGTQKVDSASYAMGLRFANFYKQQGVTSINKAILSKAINDAFGTNKTLFDDNTVNSVINGYMMKIYEKKAKVAIDTGIAFMKRNKLRPGVKTTATGLQYEVITEGTGPKPSATDSVTCHYRGVLIHETIPFDDSYSRGQPITFSLKSVIPGWTEGLQLMSVGSKYKLYVPHTLGYGLFDYGPIPGGSTLVFDVELLDIKKANK